MSRGRHAWLGLRLLGVLAACSPEGSKGSQAHAASADANPEVVVPASQTSFLELLAPLPGPGVRIVYEVDGPGSLDGTLEVMARPGGFRRENWTLRHPAAGDNPNELRGTTIQTPQLLWSGVDGESGVTTSSPLGALAEAYVALEPKTRAAVSTSLRRWHADLDRARREHPGDVREVAGMPCLQMRVAAQDLCLWEQTGLPLEYRGEQFAVRATRVELDASFDNGAFVPPAQAVDARVVELPSHLGVDPGQSLAALAKGDYGALAIMLTPGLRLPLPTDDGEW